MKHYQRADAKRTWQPLEQAKPRIGKKAVSELDEALKLPMNKKSPYMDRIKHPAWG